MANAPASLPIEGGQLTQADMEREERLKAIQMEALGFKRRERISTDEGRGSRQMRINQQALESSRLVNQAGSEAFTRAQGNRDMLSGWNSAWQNLAADSSAAVLDSLDDGQSHRATLRAKLADAYDDDPNDHHRDNRVSGRGGRVGGSGRGGGVMGTRGRGDFKHTQARTTPGPWSSTTTPTFGLQMASAQNEISGARKPISYVVSAPLKFKENFKVQPPIQEKSKRTSTASQSSKRAVSTAPASRPGPKQSRKANPTWEGTLATPEVFIAAGARVFPQQHNQLPVPATPLGNRTPQAVPRNAPKASKTRLAPAQPPAPVPVVRLPNPTPPAPIVRLPPVASEATSATQKSTLPQESAAARRKSVRFAADLSKDTPVKEDDAVFGTQVDQAPVGTHVLVAPAAEEGSPSSGGAVVSYWDDLFGLEIKQETAPEVTKDGETGPQDHGSGIDKQNEDIEQEATQEEDTREEDPKTEDPKEEDPKEEDPKEEDPKEEDPKEEDPKEEDTKEDETKEAEAKEEDIKEAEAEVQDTREAETKGQNTSEGDTKVEDGTRVESKSTAQLQKDVKNLKFILSSLHETGSATKDMVAYFESHIAELESHISSDISPEETKAETSATNKKPTISKEPELSTTSTTPPRREVIKGDAVTNESPIEHTGSVKGEELEEGSIIGERNYKSSFDGISASQTRPRSPTSSESTPPLKAQAFITPLDAPPLPAIDLRSSLWHNTGVNLSIRAAGSGRRVREQRQGDNLIGERILPGAPIPSQSTTITVGPSNTIQTPITPTAAISIPTLPTDAASLSNSKDAIGAGHNDAEQTHQNKAQSAHSERHAHQTDVNTYSYSVFNTQDGDRATPPSQVTSAARPNLTGRVLPKIPDSAVTRQYAKSVPMGTVSSTSTAFAGQDITRTPEATSLNRPPTTIIDSEGGGALSGFHRQPHHASQSTQSQAQPSRPPRPLVANTSLAGSSHSTFSDTRSGRGGVAPTLSPFLQSLQNTSPLPTSGVGSATWLQYNQGPAPLAKDHSASGDPTTSTPFTRASTPPAQHPGPAKDAWGKVRRAGI